MTAFSRLKRSFSIYGPYLVAVLSIVLPWFLHGGYLFFTDFVWGPNSRIVWTANGLPALLFMKLAGLVVSPPLAQKIFVAAVLAVILLGGQRLSAAFVEDRRLAAVVGLFFLFNPFVYDRLGYGQIFVLAAFGCFCCGAADIFEYLVGREERTRRLLLAAVWLGLTIQFSPHFIFFVAVLVLVWLVALMAITEKRTKIVFGTIVLASVIILALNANWIFASSIGTGGISVSQFSPADLEAFRTSGRTPAEAAVNVLMMSGFWGKDQYRYPDLTAFKENWGRAFLVLLPLMFLGVYSSLRDKKRRRLSALLLAAGFVSAFLAVGIAAPATKIVTTWLFSHLPFYSGLRETQKWVAAEVLVYGIFLAWGVERLFQASLLKANRVITAIFLAAVIIMQAPFILMGLNGSVRPTKYPADWQATDAYILRDGCTGQTLFLPWHMYMSFNWVGHIIANPASGYFSCSTLQGTNMEWGGIYDNSGSPEGTAVSAWLSGHGTTGLFSDGALNIKYVILAKEIDWEQYAWLDTLPELRLVMDTATLKTYEVKPKSN